MNMKDLAHYELLRADKHGIPEDRRDRVVGLFKSGDLLRAFRELAEFWISIGNDAGASYCSGMIQELLPE